jgi:hypothetical protein
MNDLVNFIKSNGNPTKTYVIQKYDRKYGYDSICWRRLRKKDNKTSSGWSEGDLTTSWEKYVFKNNIWQASNFRYPDEVVLYNTEHYNYFDTHFVGRHEVDTGFKK